MERKPISAEEAAQINDTLRQELKGTDQVIAKTGQMVSSFVDYPTYAVADHTADATVRRFELIAVDSASVIAVVMLSDSRVKSRLMQLSLPLEAETLPQISHLLNTHFTGIGSAEMNAHLMNLSDQVSGQWFLLLNQVVEYAAELLKESQQHEVFTNGASQLLKFPEFRDIDKAHDLMHFMVDSKEQLPVPADGRCGGQLRHRRRHAGSCRRGRPHPNGLRHGGGPAQLLCREPDPYVWKA